MFGDVDIQDTRVIHRYKAHVRIDGVVKALAIEVERDGTENIVSFPEFDLETTVECLQSVCKLIMEDVCDEP